MPLHSRNGTARDVKVVGFLYFSSPVIELGFADLLEDAIGQFEPDLHVVVYEQQLASQSAKAEPVAFEMLDVSEEGGLWTEQSRDRVEQPCFAVCALADEQHDDRERPRRLDEIPDQLVPVPNHARLVAGIAKDLIKRAIVLRATSGRIVLDR